MSKKLSAKYSEENKERLQNKACERYQKISKEEKEKKSQYGHEHYKNLLESEKNTLVEYRKKIAKKHFITIIRKYFYLEKFASL